MLEFDERCNMVIVEAVIEREEKRGGGGGGGGGGGAKEGIRFVRPDQTYTKTHSHTHTLIHKAKNNEQRTTGGVSTQYRVANGHAPGPTRGCG
jgi:hypothetical protein